MGSILCVSWTSESARLEERILSDDEGSYAYNKMAVASRCTDACPPRSSLPENMGRQQVVQRGIA
ncbi:unnamed protein product, partial [Ectocarpus sp. 12 AP-2014]